LEIKLKKQPAKYLASVDEPTKQKLLKALDKIKCLEGDIVCINPKEKLYRYKLAHYRIIFSYSGGDIIIVETINTRTNIKYRRYS
jgi:toxin-antitoxin system, toxin component, relE family